MPLVRFFRNLYAALILVTPISACEPVPDLSPIEASFAAGTAGAGSTIAEPEILRSDFANLIRQAVENSPDLAQSNSRVRAANATHRAARGAFLPKVSMGINARPERVISDLADVSPYLRVSQLVYDGGAASGELAAAQARVLESRGGQLQSAAATALSAIEAYVLVLNRRKFLKIADQNVKVQETIERQITNRMTGGAGTQTDVLTARSRVADAKTRLADAKAQSDKAEARYLEVFGHRATNLPKPMPAPTISHSDKHIVMNSPQVRRANATLAAVQAELAAARARRQPDMRVAAFANQDNNRDPNLGLDLSVNYELDSTGQRRAEISGTESRVAEVRFSRDALIREIGRELGFIRSDQQAGADRLRAAQKAAQANADNVMAIRYQFSIGRRTLIEILDAQRDYVNAQERLILAEQSFFLTNYAALSLKGDILDVLGITLDHWDGSP